jgi:tRNA (guanine37-N1)-methyltransferase
VIFSSPGGKTFDQNMAKSFSKEKHLVFVAGRYEGYDARIFKLTGAEQISVGDYVLTGGEAPVLTMIDATIRHINGVLESFESLDEESFNDGLLEYDHYTKPALYGGLKVPDVLISGNHKKIREERNIQAIRNTYDFRPDLIKKRSLSYKELDYLKEYVKEKYSGKDTRGN